MNMTMLGVHGEDMVAMGKSTGIPHGLRKEGAAGQGGLQCYEQRRDALSGRGGWEHTHVAMGMSTHVSQND